MITRNIIFFLLALVAAAGCQPQDGVDHNARLSNINTEQKKEHSRHFQNLVATPKYPLVGEYAMDDAVFNSNEMLTAIISDMTGRADDSLVDLKLEQDILYTVSQDTIRLKCYVDQVAEARGVDGGCHFLMLYSKPVHRLMIYKIDTFTLNKAVLDLEVHIRDLIPKYRLVYDLKAHKYL